MSNADPRGKFVWHELLSGDAAAATAFYTKVVPWKSQPWEQDSSYSMWVAKNGPVGGIAKLDGTMPPHWLPYVAVPDIDATVEMAKDLGGRVLKDKTDLPNGGSYAVLADPQGAEFAIYQAGAETGGNGSATPDAGEFSWHELATTDAKAAMEFYTKLLGWEVGPVHDMGEAAGGNYHLFLQGGNQYGGMYVSDSSGMGPSWLCYISVEDVGKATTAAKNAGGRVMNGPMEVPGGSWVAQVLDAEGAPFAVHEPAKVAKPAKTEKAVKAPKVKAEKAAAPAEPAAAEPSEAKPAEAKASEGKPAAKAAEAKPAGKPAAASSQAAPAAKKPVAASSQAAAAAKAGAKSGAKAAARKPAAKAKAPAKAAAKKGKKAAAKKKAPARKAAGKAAAKGRAKGAAKKGKKVARKAAPARKKGRAKGKKKR
jgi:predicted enzyme related to lactoylglutathione lyase